MCLGFLVTWKAFPPGPINILTIKLLWNFECWNRPDQAGKVDTVQGFGQRNVLNADYIAQTKICNMRMSAYHLWVILSVSKSSLNNYGLRTNWWNKRCHETSKTVGSESFGSLWKWVLKLKDLISMQVKNIAWWTCCIYPLWYFKSIRALFKHFMKWSGSQNQVSCESCFLKFTSVRN